MGMGDRPRYIRVHPTDNVAIVVNEGGLPAGSEFASGLRLKDAVPEAHKVALVNIAAGDAVIRYGVTIGFAERDLAAGSWVHEGVLKEPDAPELRKVRGRGAVGAVEPLEGFTFEGFVNDDGSVGTKNILGISTTV